MAAMFCPLVEMTPLSAEPFSLKATAVVPSTPENDFSMMSNIDTPFDEVCLISSVMSLLGIAIAARASVVVPADSTVFTSIVSVGKRNLARLPLVLRILASITALPFWKSTEKERSEASSKAVWSTACTMARCWKSAFAVLSRPAMLPQPTMSLSNLQRASDCLLEVKLWVLSSEVKCFTSRGSIEVLPMHIQYWLAEMAKFPPTSMPSSVVNFTPFFFSMAALNLAGSAAIPDI